MLADSDGDRLPDQREARSGLNTNSVNDASRTETVNDPSPPNPSRFYRLVTPQQP